MVRIDLLGQRFGRLVVVAQSGCDSWGQIRWTCMCDCGKQHAVVSSKLRRGSTISCGCAKAARIGQDSRTHGGSNTPEYNSYRAMLRRCYDPQHRAYPWYGGRGITVCPLWKENFTAFLADLGPRPTGWTLDRINADRNYEPGNCRWASWSVQANNKRRPHFNLPLLDRN